MLGLRPSILHNIQTLLWIWIYYYFLICFPTALPSRAFERFTELSNSIFTVLMVSSFHQGQRQWGIERYSKLFINLGRLIWHAMGLISLFVCFLKVFRTMQRMLCLCSLQMQVQEAASVPVKSQVTHWAPREEDHTVNLHLHWQTEAASNICTNTVPYLSVSF